MIVTTETYDAAALAAQNAQTAAVGPLKGSLFGLTTNAYTPTKRTTLSLLTEPTYTGYARIVGTFSAPTRDIFGNLNIESQLLTWQEITTAVAVTITGWFLVDTTGLILYWMEVFDTPVNLIDLLSVLKFVVEFIQSNPNSGQATITQ